MISASASGKIILFGEHAVVYGQPAIAVPVTQLRANAHITPTHAGHGITVYSETTNAEVRIAEASDSPFCLVAKLVLDQISTTEPDIRITISSDIPIASGLGSGAAVSTAIARALFQYFEYPVSPKDLSDLIFESEKYYHGTPSGIDNTVICYEQSVYFERGKAPLLFSVKDPFVLVIGDTGIRSKTKETVTHVRELWKKDQNYFEQLFDRVGTVVERAQEAITSGHNHEIGPLMNENQTLLREMEVSSPELDRLIKVARTNGADGAKLSGGGGGGNMIAMVPENAIESVSVALYDAGASRVLVTEVGTE